MGDHEDGRIEDAEGVVKWFDSRKGYGFVVGPENQDIFVHYSAIEGDGFRALKDGSKVRYDAELGSTGWKASRVRRVDPEVIVVPRPHSRSPRRT